jgi:hypothetical protein
MPSAVVYLGPSLRLEEARAILDAEFLPPVKRGDVDKLLRDGAPDAIGIVDGQFFQNFSISPKELLKAIEAGVKVFGSSSMGVLRAVELERYGMIGVGQIFRLFASGELDADDEVAMIYDDSNLKPISDPLVNIRVALHAAAGQGIISGDTRDLMIQEAKRIYFPERTFAYLLSRLGSEIPEAERAGLKHFLETSAPDAKREDAIELLSQMKLYLSDL